MTIWHPAGKVVYAPHIKPPPVLELTLLAVYSSHIEAPARRKPDRQFEVINEQFSGSTWKVQEDKTPN